MTSDTGALVSLFAGKCPRCRQGKVFTDPVYDIKRYTDVHTHCPVCGVKFEAETGFFWGAMYFSYALNVIVSIVTGFLLFFVFNDPELWVYMAVIIPAILILTPPMMRFSRLLMMYIFAPYRKYDPNAIKH